MVVESPTSTNAAKMVTDKRRGPQAHSKGANSVTIMHVLWSIITGFFVGLIARALLPGNDKMGFIATIVVGILGSLLGGFIGGLISKPAPGSKFHPAGFFLSLVGAILLLLLWRFIG